jgi:anhydro-N-acetylmuramic acid kinase
MGELYIGLMSGTSLDGIDAVLAQFPQDGSEAAMQVLAHGHQAFAPALRDELLSLNRSGPDELHRSALAANGLARAYADLVAQLLEQSGHKPSQIRALGAHGQTVRHRPGEFDGIGYTCQLLNGALLAEQTGIAVVCDLRSRDVAAGGQGAPLVPAFHRARFGRTGLDLAVLNIGGISNISLLHADGRTLGHDCGPGNCLMDLWMREQQGRDFDADGAWAAGGTPHPGLLQAMLAEPFFGMPAPRSTGRDLFNREWLRAHLQAFPEATAQDVQATLLELSARCVSDGLQGLGVQELLVCGGGALNGRLMERLRALLPGSRVTSTDSQGLPVMQVEATAFAWLAMRFMRQLPGNLPAVTGAAGPRLLGALHPA